MNLPPHGANPSHLYNAAGIEEPGRVIDFSVNTNPFGSPDWLREKWSSFLPVINDYPDPSGREASLAIARRFGISADSLLLGNGAAEIIHFVARLASGQKAVIVTPAFSEYEDACKAYGCFIEHVPVDIHRWELPVETLVEKAKTAAVLFICTPNNPTGKTFNEEEMISFLEKTKNLKALVLVDEAFYDFAQEGSFIRLVEKFPQLAVMHSLTKMYAVAGLRIGYVAASPSVIRKLRVYQPHWNMNAIALQAAALIAEDRKHAVHTREKIESERVRMRTELTEIGFSVLPSSVNFYLLKDPALGNQSPLLQFLLRRGLVLRHTENFRGLDGKWLRCAVKQQAENNQLLAVLKEWKSRC